MKKSSIESFEKELKKFLKIEKENVQLSKNLLGKKHPYFEYIIVVAIGEITEKDAYKFLSENKSKFSILTKNILEGILDKIRGRIDKEK